MSLRRRNFCSKQVKDSHLTDKEEKKKETSLHKIMEVHNHINYNEHSTHVQTIKI